MSESHRPYVSEVSPKPSVDLVVLINTSESMAGVAADLDAALEAALSTVDAECPVDLRVLWFGIEGTWPGTKFTQTYRTYLQEQGISDQNLVIGRWARAKGDQPQKSGAAAILDNSYHFDWRPGASRAIFYLGDEALKGGNPQTADDIKAANYAIEIARRRKVKVFMYAGAKTDGVSEAEDMITKAEYERVAIETGGRLYTAPLDYLGGFPSVLAEIICISVDSGDNPAQVPEIRPCFELRWGDGPRDNLETDDVETLYLIARNPYTNVILRDVTVLLSVVTDSKGNPAPLLPDGTPSVTITPSKMIHFGDLPSSDAQGQAESAAVVREVVLYSRKARGGDYLFDISYTYVVEFKLQDEWQSPLRLVPLTGCRRPPLIIIPILLTLLLFSCFALWFFWPPLVADPGGPYQVSEAESLRFDGSGSRGLNITTYTWDFGDGSGGNGVSPIHTYDDGPAQFAVTLTITDRWGRTDSGVTQAIVHNLPPTAEAEGPYSCFVAETIQLSGTCNDPSSIDAESLTCTWADFSGTTVSEPVYTCPSDPGQVTVTLTATDKDGASDQDTAIVTVNPSN